MSLPRVRILGPADAAARGAILNFVVAGLDSRGLALVLDEREAVQVRYGRHCVHAWYHAEGLPESVRASFGPCNTEDDVDRFVRAVTDVVSMID